MTILNFVSPEVQNPLNQESAEEDGDGGWADFSSAIPNSSRTGERAEETIVIKQEIKSDDPFADLFSNFTPLPQNVIT